MSTTQPFIKLKKEFDELCLNTQVFHHEKVILQKEILREIAQLSQVTSPKILQEVKKFFNKFEGNSSAEEFHKLPTHNKISKSFNGVHPTLQSALPQQAKYDLSSAEAKEKSLINFHHFSNAVCAINLS